MKKLLCSTALLFLVFSGLRAQGTITSPNGGESWGLGSVHDITWYHSGADTKVKFQLYQGITRIGVIVIGCRLVDHRYGWTVGSLNDGTTAPAGSGYTVRMVRQEDNVELDVSDAPFTISANQGATSLTVTWPNGGDRVPWGELKKIQWRSENLSGMMKIQILRAGALSHEISASTDVSFGSIDWVVGNVAGWDPRTHCGCNYRIRLQMVNGSATDLSDGDFCIWPSGAGIQMVFPRGGETLKQGQPAYVAWIASQLPADSRIKGELLGESGGVTPIFVHVPVYQSIHWVPPGFYGVDWTVGASTPAGLYKVRLTSEEYGTSTQSANFFAIITEEAAQLPDLTVMGATYDGTCLQVKVMNLNGTYNAPVQLRAAIPALGQLKDTIYPVHELKQSSPHTFSFPVPPWPAGKTCLEGSITVNPGRATPERNFVNNTFTGQVCLSAAPPPALEKN